jgi:hypothetical protein
MIQGTNILTTTTNTTGPAVVDRNPGGTFQAVITGTGSVTTTVTIQCSLDGVNWLTLGTISLSGTTTATDGFVSAGEWLTYRAVTSGTSGTVSSIQVLMSEYS